MNNDPTNEDYKERVREVLRNKQLLYRPSYLTHLLSWVFIDWERQERRVEKRSKVIEELSRSTIVAERSAWVWKTIAQSLLAGYVVIILFALLH